MDTKTVELSSKKKVKIKEMSIDDIDYCQDLTVIVYGEDNNVEHIKNVSKSRTAWIRHGLFGGDFKNWSTNVKGQPADSVLKELSETEKNELMTMIQEHQKLGE